MIAVETAGSLRPITLSRTLRPAAAPFRVTVVGGGVSGALAAMRLVEATEAPLAITVLEPRELLGRGEALATAEPDDLMHGPSSGLSLYPEAPMHFVYWLAAEARHGGWRPPLGAPLERSRPPRRSFGSYVEGRLAASVSDNFGRVRMRHRRDRALGIGQIGRELVVTLAAGGSLLADAVVLATGARPPEAAARGDALGAALCERGLARRPAAGPGRLDLDPETLAVISVGGRPSERLFAIGQAPPDAGPVRQIAVEARTIATTLAELAAAAPPVERRRQIRRAG
jgi:hypothetical protein